MQCVLEVFDSSLQSTSHIQCNRSFCQTTGHGLPKDQHKKEPVSFHSDNRGCALTIPPIGHYSYWIPASFLPDIQEVKVSSLASGAQGTGDVELLSAQQGTLFCSSQSNERNMYDQADSSKSGSNGFPHVGNMVGQSRHRKNVCDESTSVTASVTACHKVANESSRPVSATLRSGSNNLHHEDNSPRSPRKKGSKKRKLYGRSIHKKLNSASVNTCEENTYAASPVEVLPANLLADKLSSSRLVVKGAHLGKYGAENNNHVECCTLLNLSSVGTDVMDGSEGHDSSNGAAGESCRCVAYLNNAANSIHASKFNGSTFEYGLGEERNIYQKLLHACVCNLDSTNTWNNDNSGNCSANIEARSSTGLNDAGTHAADTNDYSICCSKDVTDSTNHIERVKCSSEASSSKSSVPFSSGNCSRKTRKTPSCSDLIMPNRVVANRHKSGGKDSSAVWQKVEKGDKSVSRGHIEASHIQDKSRGHIEASHIQDKSAQEDTDKSIQQDAIRCRAKRKKNKKKFKQEVPNSEMESTLEGDNAFNSFQTLSKSICKKQMPFLQLQRSSSFKQGSQSLKNYYAPKNGIPKVLKDYPQQEGLPLLQLVQVKDSGHRSSFCLADEVILTGVRTNCKADGKESLQSGIEKTALSSRNLVPDLVPQAASWNSRNLYADPCDAGREEVRCAKLAIEINPQESCKLYSPSGHLSQKWVPVGKKEVSDVVHLDASEASIVEGSVPANDTCDSFGHASTNDEDMKLTSKSASRLNSYRHIDSKKPTYKGIETSYNNITEAISDVCIARQRVENIQLRIGRPLADFERFMYSASPVLHCSPYPNCCKAFLQEYEKDGLCLHQTSNITLSSVWQWYEEPGCYGLEVKAQDFHRSKGLWNSQCQFTTYFVPYLSAVQLFRQPKRTSGGSIDKEAAFMDMTCEPSPYMNPPPIFEKLMPRESPRNRSTTLYTEGDNRSSSVEIIFEYFESERPYWRRQLFDKVNELIAGVKQLNCHISGDPKNLELSLHDLHPSSWYCVAWYPIYRIPDGKFQAAFLTYHSLGHRIHRSSSEDQAGQAPVAFPVIGLQSYNDKAEWWFQMSKFDAEDAESAEASRVLKERLRTLNEAAGMMSRADVPKNEGMTRNSHPDYEFFLSRSS